MGEDAAIRTLAIADVSGDGRVTALDALAILQGRIGGAIEL
ncbi:MAG: dockerin type I domain-containing protein [Euryarchaeota archaeon]|nr:dockerin type I domain-containing protein [Euryarchaeota archaeon]